MAAPTAPAPSAAAPSPQLPAYLAPVVDFVCDGDALAVVARGLSATVNVVAEVLRRCGGGDGRGVLVLNMNAREPALRDALRRLGGGAVAVAAASETSRAARAAVYGGGGVVLCGCRVAVVDLLDGTMDAARLGGIIIADAHRATERSLEAFVVRAFRERERPAECPRAWVRGITEEPERLARGFGNLSKVVKELQVDAVGLWPRFEHGLASALERNPPPVFELRRGLGGPAAAFQRAVVVAVDACVRELRGALAGRADGGADVAGRRQSLDAVLREAAASASAFFGCLDDALRSLRSRDEALAPAARALAGDVAALRRLLEHAERGDGLACLELTEATLRAASARGRDAAAWATGAAADALLNSARRRVFEFVPARRGQPARLRRVLEPSPRLALAVDAVRDGGGGGTCVLVVADASAAAAAADALERGPERAGEARFLKYLERSNAPFRDRPKTTLERSLLIAEEASLRRGGEPRKRTRAASWRRLVVATRSELLDGCDALGDWRPDRVVLADAHPDCARALEAYGARSRRAVEVYAVVVDGGADEASRAAQVDRERSAFLKLVTEKELVVVPSAAAREAARRRARPPPLRGGKPPSTAVVADAREFRAPLPSALHGAGLDLRPATITVGDYVLSPELVVERKAVGDLHGSLQSGRLVAQAEAMGRHYATPLLLVETTKSLRGTSAHVRDDDDRAVNRAVSNAGDGDDLCSTRAIEARVAVLAMHFPRLRFLWAGDDAATAALFLALKRVRGDPVLEDARRCGAPELDDDAAAGGRNQAGLDVLMKLPGVNAFNVRAVVDAVDSLADLGDLGVDELRPLVGKHNARLLFDFLRRPLGDADVARTKRADPRLGR